MRRAERLFRLIDEMRTRGVSRACDLAARLEVSPSTIYRDIAHLQASGLPIEGEPGVGYLLRPGFDLPAMAFTHDQIQAIAMGLAFVERTGDPELAAAAREARAKIQASMPDPQGRVLADAPFFSLHGGAPSPVLAVVRRAIRERQVIAFGYRDGQGSDTQRRLRPLVIWALPEGAMVSGYCELRQDFRTFRLDRMQRTSATGIQFQTDASTDLAAFLDRDGCETP